MSPLPDRRLYLSLTYHHVSFNSCFHLLNRRSMQHISKITPNSKLTGSQKIEEAIMTQKLTISMVNNY